MRTIIKLLFFAAVFSIIASCGKNPYKILKQKEGTWNATTETTITGFGTFVETSQITFYEGSATVLDTAGKTSGFNWAYDKKSEQITLTTVAGIFVANVIYKVSDVTADAEKWTFVSQNLNGVDQPAPGYSETISLTRR